MPNVREENNGHASKAHRLAAEDARKIANNLAVNCRSQLGRIKGTKGWERDRVLEHWVDAFGLVLTTLTRPTPSPWNKPVEAPPDGVAVLPSANGSAGGGDGRTVGGDGLALPTSVEDETDWDEIYGRQ